MAWEIESEHLDLAEMEHVTVFVERNVTTRSGEPQRHLLQIRLGDHLDLTEKGEIVDADGKPYDHRAKQQEVLAELTRRHKNARQFAQRHNVRILKGREK